MDTFLYYAQVLVSLGLIGLIVVQERSSGIGGAFGSGSEFYQTRRGLEKVALWATVVLAVLFIALALANHLG
jgi:protein translocase SecG subunit